MLRAPRLHPRADASLKARNNLVGDFLIKIRFHWLSPSKPGCACNPSRPAPMSEGAAVKVAAGEGDHPVCTIRQSRRNAAKAATDKNKNGGRPGYAPPTPEGSWP